MTKKVAISPRIATARGALMVYLQPRLAQDASLDLKEVLKGTTSRNFAQQIPTIVGRLAVATKGKLAKDASIDDVVDVLNAVGKTPETEEAPAMQPAAGGDPDNEPEMDPDPEETNIGGDDVSDTVCQILQEAGVDPAVIEEVKKAMAPADALEAGEEAEEETKENMLDGDPEDHDQSQDEDPDDKDKDKKDMVTKPAMDAAIRAAVNAAQTATVKRMNALRDAEKAVRPYIGDIQVAMDSADAVYKFALDKLGVKTEGVHASAYPTMLGMVPKPGDEPARPRRMAADADSLKTYNDLLGEHAGRSRVIG